MVGERLIHRWLDYWHGSATETSYQYRYYRCAECHRLVTWQKIRRGGCACGAVRMRPAVLSRWDMTRCVVLPWTV